MLLAAVIGTQMVATLIAVLGVLMAPIGWWWALAVWAYALAWFLLNDRVKIVACRLLERRPPATPPAPAPPGPDIHAPAPD